MDSFINQDIDQENLIALLHNRDIKAMELLYDHYSASVYGVACIITKSESAAEKILKETFMYAWKHHATYNEDNQNMKLWLIGITRRIAHAHISFDDFLKNQADLNYVSSTRNDVTENKMTGMRKQVFELVFFGGGKTNDVAKQLSTNEQDIKQLLREAIHQYRKELQ